MTLIPIVKKYSDEIDNGRTLQSILDHLKTEVIELDDEIEGNGDGKDGIVGESIDIILCALDIIFKHSPNVTEEEINAIAKEKCEKWKRIYS